MKSPRMRPIKAWALIDRTTGEAWNEMTYATKVAAKGVRGRARGYRIARVKITEVK
jgi:hypothetical protein